MTRVDTLALGAVVAAWLVGVGFAAGCWWTRRRWAAHRAYTAILERNLDGATQALVDLRVEFAELQRIFRDFTQQRLRDAEQGWPLPDGLEVPPSVWAALREAEEHWSEN
jgi:hypothetical protein